ncbi:TonB-dependent receptor [Flavobacterium rhizosphaerae]|uniref:TonB-dependent receptor n=1 Tax=Flavobacterium rhizosphaerae TaxID=3163298 RepID=A0ABW8YZF2_9FLAO
MKLKFLAITFFFIALGYSQDTGVITGTVTDKDMNNETLPFASVAIKGTSIGTNTDDNGKYSLKVPAGNHTLVFAFLGYETIEVPVSVKAGETKTINKVMSSSSVLLEDVIIETVVNREKESALLLEQKNAVEMKQAIGAQELSRKGVGDAAAAVVKTSGVTKQEGVNNVFVRGLGDRYNSTTLNGLPLPSEDPVYKNISLDFFSTKIIKNININKTFSADLYGDVAGANIDISSKELEKNSYFSVAAGAGINTNVMDATFLVADGAYNYFGFLENGKDVPVNNLTDYSFKTSFKPVEKSTPINSNFNILGGKKLELANGNTLSLFGVVLNNNYFQYKEGHVRQISNSGGFRQDLDFKSSEYKASQALLGNVKYKFDKGSIGYNTLYIHDNNQSVGDYNGYSTNVNDNNEATNSIIRRQQLNNNNLFVNQLVADYKFTDKISANGGVSYNMMRGSEPDRRTNSYDYDYNGNEGHLVASNSAGLNNRFFSTLDEDDITGRLEGNYTLNPEENLLKIVKVGVNVRHTERTFNFSQINYDVRKPIPIDINNPDSFFNQANLTLGKANDGFDFVTHRGRLADAFDPFYYEASRDIYAAYGLIIYPFNEKITAQLGVRFEDFEQTIDWDTNLSSSVNNLTIDPSNIKKTYVLPSATLKYSLNEAHTIRFAASETYTMPQFKETAPFLYESVNYSEFGNPYLVPSTDYNIDLKYDWYFTSKEIVSIGALYKYIQDPISRIRVNSAANDYSYVNTDHAFVAGIEAELRKNIYSVESDNRTNEFTFGLNASYLYTEQVQNDTDKDNLTVLFTHDKGKMQGAAPWLVNSDLSYTAKNDTTELTSTLVFNYFYDKVYSVGTGGNENIVEKSVPTLDFINKFEFLNKNLQLSLSVNNILDPKFRLTQDINPGGNREEATVSTYKKGMFFSVGVNWTL